MQISKFFIHLQENKEGAIEDSSEAIDLNSKYIKAIVRRAQLYEETDKPHESLKDFESVLEIDPKHIESIVAVRVRNSAAYTLNSE